MEIKSLTSKKPQTNIIISLVLKNYDSTCTNNLSRRTTNVYVDDIIDAINMKKKFFRICEDADAWDEIVHTQAIYLPKIIIALAAIKGIEAENYTNSFGYNNNINIQALCRKLRNKGIITDEQQYAIEALRKKYNEVKHDITSIATVYPPIAKAGNKIFWDIFRILEWNASARGLHS